MAFTDDELLATIRGGESDRVEFTESTRDWDKFREAICGFANDLPDHRKPGLLFVGLGDDGTCAGLTVDDALLTKLAGLRGDGAILPLPSMTVEKRNLDGCDAAVVQVLPSDNPPVKAGGRCWIRIGPRRGQATAEEERRLTEKRRWGNMLFDMHGVAGATVENDLDMRRFELEYLPAAVSPEALEANARDLQAQLPALRLTTANGTPTVAAVLMLGKDPRYWFPGAYIQFVRYAGDDAAAPVQHHAEVRGVLSTQLREAEMLLKANIRVALDMRGMQHVEKPDYPLEALQEIVRNAIVHRNYENSTAPVRIIWFDDRVEITSPGSVFGEVTREKFGTGVVAYRNPTIAEALKNLDLIQRFGQGINRARAFLADNGNPPPQFDIHDTYIVATIRK